MDRTKNGDDFCGGRIKYSTLALSLSILESKLEQDEELLKKAKTANLHALVGAMEHNVEVLKSICASMRMMGMYDIDDSFDIEKSSFGAEDEEDLDNTITTVKDEFKQLMDRESGGKVPENGGKVELDDLPEGVANIFKAPKTEQ